MKEVRAEYKLLMFLGIVFAVILLFFLIKDNTFKKIANKYKESTLVSCKEKKEIKGIEYTNYTCVIKDEVGKSYTISYPSIKEVNKDISKINDVLKSDYDSAYNTLKYNSDSKLVLDSYQTTNFKIYSSNGIVSLLVEKKDIVNNIVNTVNKYNVYNIDADSYEVLDNKSLKKRLGIDSIISSKIRGKIILMYLEKFRYDYNNEMITNRNSSIDESIGSITYSSISNVYVDDEGNVLFILYLYNPNYGEKVPYQFMIDSNKNISYDMILS